MNISMHDDNINDTYMYTSRVQVLVE